METVELIASGYEWICPFCYDEGNPDCTQHEIEITDTVTCRTCDEVFRTDEIHHAYK